MRIRKELAAHLAGCAVLLAGCGEEPGGPTGPRLVILYAPCTVNRSYLAPYEPSVPFTPNLAAFARESVVFRRHTAETGQCGTDYAALFTGTQAYEHGVYHQPTPLGAVELLITETFARRGYRPYFWNGHPNASIVLGYGQGVPMKSSYRMRGVKKLEMLKEEDPAFTRLLDMLAEYPNLHALVVANFSVTQSLYHQQAPPGALESFLQVFPRRANGVTLEELQRWVPIYEQNALGLQWDFPATIAKLGLSPQEVERLSAVLEVLYQTDVAYLDVLFGEMLAAVRSRGLYEEALIVFTADHGELLRRENALFQWTHGLELAPEVLDIPLLIHGPGLQPGDYEGVSRSIDVYPTLAGLCDVETPPDQPPEGVDLAPALRGEGLRPELLAFSHTATMSAGALEAYREFALVSRCFPRTDPALCWVRVRKGDVVAKLRGPAGLGSAIEVFDLARDPRETTNLYDPSSSEQALLTAQLERYRQRLVENFGRQGEGVGLSEEPDSDDR